MPTTDPYAGLGVVDAEQLPAPVADKPDPYAGLGVVESKPVTTTPVVPPKDPYAGLGTVEQEPIEPLETRPGLQGPPPVAGVTQNVPRAVAPEPPETEGAKAYKNELSKALQELQQEPTYYKLLTGQSLDELDQGFIRRSAKSFLATGFMNLPAAGMSYYGRQINEQNIKRADAMTPEERTKSARRVAQAYATALAMEPSEAQGFKSHMADILGTITGFIGPTPGAKLVSIGAKTVRQFLPEAAARTLGRKVIRGAAIGAGAGAIYGAAKLPTVAPTDTAGDIALRKAGQFLATEVGFAAFGTGSAATAHILPKAFYRQYDWTPKRFQKEFPYLVRRVAANQGTESELRLVQDVNAYLEGLGQKPGAYARGKAGLDVQIAERRAWVDVVPVLRDILSGVRTAKITGGAPAGVVAPPVVPSKATPPTGKPPATGLPPLQEVKAEERLPAPAPAKIGAKLPAQKPVTAPEMPIERPLAPPLPPTPEKAAIAAGLRATAQPEVERGPTLPSEARKRTKTQTLQERMAEATGQDQTFLDWIRTDLKGIRKGTDISEEMYGYKGRGGPIDISLRPKRGEKGTKLDDAAEQAFSKGFITEPDSRLFLEKIESSRRAEQRLSIEEKAEQEHLQNEIEKAKIWEETQNKLKQSGKGEEANPHIMDVNGTFSINGEKHKVIAEGKNGIKVIDGESFWITFTRPEFETARIFIDKDSYKPPEETPVKKPAAGELLPAEDLQLVGGKAISDAEQMRRDAIEANRIEVAMSQKLEEQARDLFAKPIEPAAQVPAEPTRADFNARFDALKKTPNPDTGKNFTEPEIYTAIGDQHFKEGDTIGNRELIDKLNSLGAAKATEITPITPVDIVKKNQSIIDEMPIPDHVKREMKRNVGLRNTVGAIGFEKQAKVEPDSPNVIAVDMQRVFDKQRQEVSDKFKITGSKILDTYLTQFTSADAPIIRRIKALPGGEKVVIDKVLSSGWPEKQGEDYARIQKYIKEYLHYRLNNSFDDFLQARRTIEVSNLMRENRGIQPELFAEGELPDVIKSPEGKGAIPNRTWIEEFKRIHPKDLKALELAANRWDETMRTIMDEYLQEGLINQETHNYLIKNHQAFSPRKFIQHLDPPTEINQGGKIISIPSSGLEALDTGSEKSLVNNSNYLLSRVLAVKGARIFKNRANRSLYDFISINPDNPLKLKIETPTETEKSPASDMTRISVMINGEQKTMTGPTELLKTWIQTDPQLSRQTAAVFQWMFGGKILKPLATGYSPFFALRNPFRDFAHYWFVTDEWSPHKPVAWAQQSQDIKDVWNDVMHNGRLTKLYLDTGGGTSFLSSQGRLGRSVTGTREITNDAVDQIENALAWLPRKSEILGRVALMVRTLKNRAKEKNITFEQALQNKDMVKEAVYVAKSALDFAQGGRLVKTLDNMKPYLNAAVQAGKTSANAFRERPLETTYKVAQVVAIAAAKYFALYYLTKKTYEKGVKNQWDNYTGIENIKKCWDNISDADDAGNWTFPTPFFKKDRNGRKRYFYFRIPVEQTQQAFKVIGEESARMFMTGEEPRWKKLAQALSNLSPIDIQTLLPPTVAAVMGYASNKDFWTGQNIWKGRTVPPSLEFDVDTPTGWKLMGKAGLSPKRLQKSISQVIPQNDYLTIFTGVSSAMQLAEDDTLNQKVWTILTRTPGLRGFFKVTQPVDLSDADIQKAKQYKIPTKYPDGEPMPRQLVMRKISEKELDVNSIKQLNDIHMDTLYRLVRDKEIKREDIKSWIGTIQGGSEKRRLLERLREKYPPKLER